jgi:hypothetical protein
MAVSQLLISRLRRWLSLLQNREQSPAKAGSWFFWILNPALKRWATVKRPLTRTKEARFAEIGQFSANFHRDGIPYS